MDRNETSYIDQSPFPVFSRNRKTGTPVTIDGHRGRRRPDSWWTSRTNFTSKDPVGSLRLVPLVLGHKGGLLVTGFIHRVDFSGDESTGRKFLVLVQEKLKCLWRSVVKQGQRRGRRLGGHLGDGKGRTEESVLGRGGGLHGSGLR